MFWKWLRIILTQRWGPEILFSVPANTIIPSKIQTHAESALSDTQLSEWIKQQSINYKEPPKLGGTLLHHSLSPHNCEFFFSQNPL